MGINLVKSTPFMAFEVGDHCCFEVKDVEIYQGITKTLFG